MVRLLFCLPLCLLIVPTYPEASTDAFDKLVVVDSKAVANEHGLPDPQQQPIAFLEACLKHCDKTVQSYSLHFKKQERISDKQQEPEEIEVHFREKPYCVYFYWQLPADRLVKSALYLDGENKGSDGKSRVKVLTRFGLKADRDPDGTEARGYGRYPMNTFGLKQAMERVLETWKAAKKANALYVKYDGLKKTNLTGDLDVHVFHRTKYARPEGDDGVGGLTIFIDSKTLLQVGSIVYDTSGQKLGAYFFSDIRINPQFEPNQFTPAALKK
jgi:hypothetical protein